MELQEAIPPAQYPPGIRFHPSDAELISYYLDRKVKCLSLPPNVITDIELYSYNPWDLPRKTLFGDDEWYFFTPRDRKYPKGGRPNRTTAAGYWKATGTDKAILSSCGSRNIGVKKGLVFYKGKPPNGHKMEWTMTEYRLPDASRPSRSKGSMRLDDWVLCRIRQKGNMSKNEEPNIKSLSSGSGGRNHMGVTEYNYLQSSEHQRIVSLLLGPDQTIPTTIYESPPRSWNSNGPFVHDQTIPTTTTSQDNLYFSSDTSVLEMIMNEPNNCKPTYPLNATMDYLFQNNTNLC
ncbi:hypothetical protein ACS0TY_020400 [Phlomoides rotata]